MGTGAPTIIATSAWVQAQDGSGSSPIGYPGDTLCAVPAMVNPLETPIVPGLYGNPSRPHTSWALGFDTVAGSPAVKAEWFTFDAAKRPVWLHTAATQIEVVSGGVVRRATAPLIRRSFSALTGAYDDATVGTVAFVFRQDNPRRVAVRWAWLDESQTTITHDECLSNAFEGQSLPVLSPATVGIWQLVNYPEYRFGEFWGQTTAGATFSNQRVVRLYDGAGYPAWLRTDVVSSPSSPPLDNILVNASFKAVTSPYTSGIPKDDCPEECNATTTVIGLLARQFEDPTRGAGRVSVTNTAAIATTNQAFTPARSIPSATATTAIRKITNVDSVHVTPTTCNLSAGACQIRVRWDSNYPQARVFQQPQTGAATLINPESQGDEQITISSAGVYQFQLKRFSDSQAPILALSAYVTVTGGSTPPPTGRDWSSTAPLTPDPPTAITEPGAGISNVEVGATKGTFEVDASGAATYTIPLMTAPATAGFAPSVAIQYRSTAGDGPMGLGFSLSGLSSISRCRKSLEHGDGPGPHPEVLYTAADSYCLDGQRLIEVASEGLVRKYRTEIDSYANIIAYSSSLQASGPDYWRVWTKDGRELLYGLDGPADPQATCQPAAPTTGAICNGRVRRAASSSDVASWLLSKSRNRGEVRAVIEYGYEIGYEAGAPAGRTLLTQIRYSGTDSVVSNGSPVTPQARLQFIYIDEAGKIEKYSSGTLFTVDKTLTKIDSFNADGVLIHEYHLGYQDLLPIPLGAAEAVYARPYLTSVQEKLGTSELRKTKFAWTTRSFPFAASEPTSSQSNATFAALRTIKPMAACGRLTHFLFAKSAQQSAVSRRLHVAIADVNAAGQITYTDMPLNLYIPGAYAADRAYHLLDFNQDGIEDLLVARCPDGTCGQDQAGNWRIYLGNGGGKDNRLFFEDNWVALPNPITVPAGDARWVLDSQLADFNGDGLVDFIAPYRIGAGHPVRFRVYLQRRAQTGFACNIEGFLTSNCPYEFAPPIDVDIALAGGQSDFQVALPKYSTRTLQVADINGDGMVDLLMRVCTSCPGAGYSLGEDPDREAEEGSPSALPMRGTTADWFWMVFENKGLQGSGQYRLEERKRWRTSGPDPQQIVALPSAVNFRFADINGDGLADILARRRSGDVSLGWKYELNTGFSFNDETCVQELALPNRAGVGMPCALFASPELTDADGDGDADLVAGFAGGETGPVHSSCAAQPLTPNYRALMWTGNRYEGHWRCAQSLNLGTSTTDHANFLLDLDGDGQFDHLRIKLQTLGGDNGEYTVTRRAPDYRHISTNAVTEIENGLGAKTTIEYSSLMMGDTYDVDGNAPFIRSGRGSPVFDILGPMYVTARVGTSAPIDGNLAAMRYSRHRYVGAKIQGNGRGHLGFRKHLVLVESNLVEMEATREMGFPKDDNRLVTRKLQTLPPRPCAEPLDRDRQGCRAVVDRFCPLSQTVSLNAECDGFRPLVEVTLGEISNSAYLRQDVPPTSPFSTLGQQIPVQYWRRQTNDEKFAFDNVLQQSVRIYLWETKIQEFDAAGNVVVEHSGDDDWAQEYNNLSRRTIFTGASAYPDWLPSLPESITSERTAADFVFPDQFSARRGAHEGLTYDSYGLLLSNVSSPLSYAEGPGKPSSAINDVVVNSS